MSLPPGTVQVKRKRTDEPVDYLRVEESNGQKKRRVTDYLFSRQPSEPVQTTSPITSPLRHIQQPIPRAGTAPSLTSHTGQLGSQDVAPLENIIGQSAQQTIVATGVIQQITVQTPSQSIQRSFYISRDALSAPSAVTSAKRKAQVPIVFSERRHKRSREGSPTDPIASAPAPALVPEPSWTALKKPGKGARAVAKPAVKSTPTKPPTSTFNIRVPSGVEMPWDVDSEQLAAEMQAYTIEEITRTLAATSTTPPKLISSKPSTPSKFKPKAPKLRYHERHPEEFISQGQYMDVDDHQRSGDEEIDDSEYIIDTYIRMPAETVITDLDLDNNLGLLVLDGDADIEEFYRDELDEDEEQEDEDEDENAENHYSADYPDEEIESDDEFGRNPYNYRKNQYNDPEDNYSDDSDDDAAFSDDEGTRYPWKAKPLTTQAF